MKLGDVADALHDQTAAWPALVPPNRVSVCEGAADILKLSRPGGGSTKWNPNQTPYMIEPTNLLASRRFSAVCFVGGAQLGKALDVDTPIPTPGGWSTMGELQVGDVVFDERGKPTRVTFATPYQHGRQCFTVTFDDGQQIVADAEHLWTVDARKKRKNDLVIATETLSTTQMIERGVFYGGRGRRRFSVPAPLPVECAPAEFSIDPYLLGVWLGDGSTGHASITAQVDDGVFLATQFLRAGHDVGFRMDRGQVATLLIDKRPPAGEVCGRGHKRTGRYRCNDCNKIKYHLGRMGEKVPRLTHHDGRMPARLRALGVLGNKHIPAEYLRGSIEQRQALLQGLMDTDGTVDASTPLCEFTTVLPALRDGVMELLYSLGVVPHCYDKRTSWTHKGEKKFGHAFRISFSVPAWLQPFRLPRKVERLGEKRAGPAARDRFIVSIEPIESRPVKCIGVDSPNHLYLAGRAMIPTHNTAALMEAGLAHFVVNDPGDMVIYQMTQEKAREYSEQRIKRAIRHSPKLREMLGRAASDDNLHDKTFRNGMRLKLAWPTVPNMSSSSYRYAFGTDYDRWPDDIGGEGDGFTLMTKRTQTFMSRGMTCIESTPGREVTTPDWNPSTPHEAPPVAGILGVYNRGDRRRFYWQCPHCREYLQVAPGLGHFRLPSDTELLESIRTIDIGGMARQYARIICPNNGCIIGAEHRPQMNRTGVWLRDGLTIDDRGRVSGNPVQSSIASFWLGGMAAAFLTWQDMLERHLQALYQYAMTGSELELKTTVNTDQGLPYTPRKLIEAKANAGDPESRAEPDLRKAIVPAGARFLVATVDVQGGVNARFVVQVHAIGEYQEQWLIDRYAITESEREGHGGNAPIDPAAYAEDWDVLTSHVVDRCYPTECGTYEMRVRAVLCDSGGEDGVTERAYAWWRRLRAAGKHRRVFVTKGHDGKLDWWIRETWVGGSDQHAGDVPLQLLNANLFKDDVDGALRRAAPGPGYMHFPVARSKKHPDAWLLATFWDEMRAELRNEAGKWEQHRKRNEAFDLCYMARAACMIVGAHKPAFWESPPAWAKPWDQNSDCVAVSERRAERKVEREAVAPRRSARSSYFG